MFRVGICDDEITTCAELERMILNIGKEIGIEVAIDVWYTGSAFIEDIEKNNKIDLLFLDIQLPDIDGINIGMHIREMKNYGMLIAYISSKKNYAMKLFQNQPIAFLIKPLQKSEVVEIIKKGYKCFQDKRFTFEYKKERDYYFLDCKDIMYLESFRKKIKIVLMNDEEDEFYGKLVDIFPKLPEYFSFIHQSYIINRNFVKKYSYEEILMINDKVLPISKVHRNELRNQIQIDRARGSI